jgi:hypothetical protein
LRLFSKFPDILNFSNFNFQSQFCKYIQHFNLNKSALYWNMKFSFGCWVVECQFLICQKLYFSINIHGQTSHPSMSKVIFFLFSFMRRIKQVQTFNFCTQLLIFFLKNTEQYRFLALYFDLWCTQNCEKFGTKKVSYKSPHL